MRHISELYSIHGGKLKKHIIIHPKDSDDESCSDDEGSGLGGGLYAGSGRSIKSDLKKAGKYITAKKGGLASTLVNYGIPAVTSGLGGAAAVTLVPEGGPVSGLVGSQLGGYAGKKLSKYIDSSAGTGIRGRGRPRKLMGQDLIHIDVGSHNARRDIEAGTGFVPPSGPNKRSNLPRVAYTGGFRGSASGGKLKGDLVQSYNKVVPKSMQPAVNELAGQVGNYALDKAGYGEPIPVKGNGLKKGSQAARDHMARIRAMRKK